MAVLPEQDRQRIWRGLMRWWCNVREETPFGKVLLKSAVDAADTWVDNNATSYNNALPAQFRNNATTAQKSLLLVAVVLMRFNLDLLKRVFGDVD